MTDIVALQNLEAVAAVFGRAKAPEDVFGAVSGATTEERKHAVNMVYRKLALVVHPDKHVGTSVFDLSSRLFAELGKRKTEADQKIDAGTYGNGKPHEPAPFSTAASVSPQVIKTPKRQYLLTSLATQGDLADVYRCSFAEKDGGGSVERHAAFKIAQSPADNDLLESESKTLGAMYPASQASDKFYRYLPKPYDSFLLRQSGDGGAKKGRVVNRRVNILRFANGYVTLADVIRAYPDGLDFRDAVWMLKRALAGLGFVHGDKDFVHGAVLPPHLLVHPTGHGMKIVDWCYAVPSKGTIKAVSKPYRHLYPPEVLAKRPATAETDLYMLAKVMVLVLGGKAETNQMPDRVPKQLRAFIGSCLLEAQGRRPSEAWTLHEELDAILLRLVGPPTYRPLAMP